MIDEKIEDVTFENNDDSPQDLPSTENDEKGANEKPLKKSRKTKAEKKLEELTKKNNELNDKYLRLYSEFDNYRKRTNKERLDLLRSASQEVIIDLLPVIDDFDRAIKAMEEHGLNEETKKGLELIYNKFFNILSQKGLEPMNSLGKDFDTDYHEAITNIPAPDNNMIGKVVDVIEKGYLLNGKIIRFAKVVVGS
ncbi:MAG: nucleotide exchange factor GrpE [Bacteroidetes bacterium]|nr:nucleotide exchange factor GrpE [Bacteroidota bacterium]MBL6943144.1 nucleotide exchange factor GrpE [Bacteroidales bacterium]